MSGSKKKKIKYYRFQVVHVLGFGVGCRTEVLGDQQGNQEDGN